MPDRGGRCGDGGQDAIRARRLILAEMQVLVRLLEQAVEAFETITDKIDQAFGFKNRADA